MIYQCLYPKNVFALIIGADIFRALAVFYLKTASEIIPKEYLSENYF